MTDSLDNDGMFYIVDSGKNFVFYIIDISVDGS